MVSSFYQQARLQAFLSPSNYSLEMKTRHAAMTGNGEIILVLPTKGGYFRLGKRLCKINPALGRCVHVYDIRIGDILLPLEVRYLLLSVRRPTIIPAYDFAIVIEMAHVFTSPQQNPTCKDNRNDEGNQVLATKGIYWLLGVSCFTANPGKKGITPLEINAEFNAERKLGAQVPP